MFNFQHSQIFRKWVIQLAEFFFQNDPAKATSKFDVCKIFLPLSLSSKRDAVYKNERASKIPICLQDKVNRPLG